MAQRYERSVTYQPPGADFSAAQTQGQLASVLSEFSRGMSQRYSEARAAEGAKAGALAGALGTPKPKNNLTAYGRAFNHAATRSYYGSAVSDVERQVATIEAQAKDDPDKFLALAAGYAKGASKEWIEDARPDLEVYLKQRVVEAETRIRKAQALRIQEQQRVDTLEGAGAMGERATELWASADPADHLKAADLDAQLHTYLDTAKADGTLSPSEVSRFNSNYFDSVEKRIATARVDRASRQIIDRYRASTRLGDDALAAIDEDGQLSPTERDVIRRDVRTQLELVRSERKRQYVDTLAEVERQIVTEQATPATAQTVHRLYEQQAMSPDEYASNTARIAKVVLERTERDAESQALQDSLGAGLPLDPKNAQHRKAVSSAFKQSTQGEPAGSQSWQLSATSLAMRTRMLPDQALAWTRQTARSPDTEIAAAGAQFYGAVAAGAPDAVGEVDTDTRAFASTVNSMIEAGTDPQRAVETARANVFDLKPQVIERRKTEFTQLAKQSDVALEGMIDRDFDPGLFASAPSATIGLKADFVSQSERYFQKTGDITIARQLAWADLKRVYGPSSVNGDPVLTAFPIERFGVRPEDVRTDIGNFLKGNPQADGSSAADVYVIPDAITLRDVRSALDGRAVQPTYKLLTKSGDLVLDRHGVPKRYTIPSGEELSQRLQEAKDKAAADGQALVEEARQKRERAQRQVELWEHNSTAPGVHR